MPPVQGISAPPAASGGFLCLSAAAVREASVVFLLLVKAYSCFVGAFFAVFVPQKCGEVGGQAVDCTFAQNVYEDIDRLNAITLAVNAIAAASLLAGFVVEFRRERWIILHLDVDYNKSEENLKGDLDRYFQLRHSLLAWNLSYLHAFIAIAVINVANVALGLVILLPLAAGKALREGSRRARDFAAAQKQRLKMLSSALLISVPWMSMSSASDDIGRAAPANILALTLLGVLLHALLLGFNNGACLLLRRAGLRIALAERKAVVVNCSQKTLNTAVSVIAFLPAALGDKGLITVPCILAHFAQIIMDGFVVARWKHVTTEDAGDGGASPAAEEGAAAAPPAPPAPAAAPDDVEAWGATGRVLARGEGDLKEAAR